MNVKEYLKQASKTKQFSIYFGIAVIALFLLIASMAPQIGERFGFLTATKQNQQSFAQEAITLTHLTNLENGWEITSNIAAGKNTVQDIVSDSQGNVYIAGTSFDSANQKSEIFVAKLTALGEVVWTDVVGGAENKNDYITSNQANDISINPENNVIAVGFQTQPDGKKSTWAKMYSPDGDAIWEKRLNTALDHETSANDVAIDSSGNIYLAGTTIIPGLGSNIVVFKLNSSGDEVWVKTFSTNVQTGGNTWPGNDNGFAISINSQGEIFISGTHDYSPQGQPERAWLAQIDENGNLVWENLSNNISQGLAIAATSDNVYLVGRHIQQEPSGDSYGSAFVQKFTTTGKLIGSEIYDTQNNNDEFFRNITLSADGSIYAIGSRNQDNQKSNIWIRKYSQDLELVMEQVIDGPVQGLDQGEGITQTPDGAIYAAGTIELESASNVWLRKFNSF